MHWPPHPSLSPHDFPLQFGTHSGSHESVCVLHTWPAGQPPHFPAHPSDCPHVLPAQLGVHEVTHCFETVLHVVPLAHPVQTPLHPSGSPHDLPAQLGVQTGLGFLHVHVTGSHVRPLAGHAVHWPPQPSDAPHVLLVHEGVQPGNPPSPPSAGGLRLASAPSAVALAGPAVVADPPSGDGPSKDTAS
jgi:hypothetical protein